VWVNPRHLVPLLGPITVALYLAGDNPAPRTRSGPQRHAGRAAGPAVASSASGESARLGLVLLLALLACLFIPITCMRSPCPPQLGFGDAARALREDPHFRSVFISPLVLGGPFYLGHQRPEHRRALLFLLAHPQHCLTHPGRQLPRDVWYWRRPWCSWHLPCWPWSARSIPFFAVVAAPIAALTCSPGCVRQDAPQLPRPGSWPAAGCRFFGRALLLAAAIPGWVRPHRTPPGASAGSW